MGEVDDGVEIFSNFNIEGISDLCKDNDDNYLILPPSPPTTNLSPSSCIEHPSPLQSDSTVSSWIQGIEQMLFNDLDLLSPTQNQIQSHDDFLPDDFFADLHLPIPDQQVIASNQSQSGSQIVKDSTFEEENTPPISCEIQSNQNNSSSPQDDDFLGLILDVPVDQFDDVPLFIDNEYSTPESGAASSEDPGEKDNNFPSSSSEDKAEDQKQNSAAASEDKEDDDPLTKKRKRQMRNRDAAVRSRERKKIYVKDLEAKSQYLERECIRLQRLLQCCSAQNHALHLQLQEKAFMASRTKQESAVLLLESLLLGSLLWFLGIMGLSLPLEPQLPAGVLVKMGSNNQGLVDLVVPGRAKSKSIGLGTFFMNRRCKASRSKMKTVACYNAVFA